MTADRQLASILAIVLVLSATPALAVLQVDPSDSRLTIDSITGLRWLDLTETTNLSYDDILADVGGWKSAGFRFATGAEVCDLFNNYMPCAIDPCPRSTILTCPGGNHLHFISDYLGLTRTTTIPSPGLLGNFDDGGGPDVGQGWMTYNAMYDATPMRIADDATPSSTSDPTVGNFLILVDQEQVSAENSECATWIPVVGTQLGAVHGSLPGSTDQSITIVVRSIANMPVAGATVELDYSACNDLSLCDAVIPGAGTVTCGPAGPAGNIVTAVTNAAGEVSLTVIGAASDPGGSPGLPGPGPGCVVVRANGVTLCQASSYALNQNGVVSHDGVNGADLAIAKNTIVGTLGGWPYRARADFSCDYGLSGLDLAIMKTLVLESVGGIGSATGCNAGGPAQAPYCP